MANAPVSRTPLTNPFADPTQPTLHDLLASLATLDLPERRRHDTVSAIRTFARVAGKELSELPAHPGFLGRVAATCAPQVHGIQRERWNNVISLLRGALEAGGRTVMPGRYLAPLSPAWDTLFHALPDIQLQRCLSRLLHFCSAAGLAPDQVDEAVLLDFQRALENEAITKNPQRVYEDACRAWNRAAADVPGWPQWTVTIPSRRQPYTLPLSAFPPSLAGEMEAYVARLAGDDPLECDFKTVKPSTAKHRLFQLRQIASALVAQGRPASELCSLADLVRIDAARLALRFFFNRADKKKTTQLASLAGLLKAVAEHWVKTDDAHLDQLRALTRQLKPESTGMTAKNRDRLRPFHDEAQLAALFQLPQQLLAEAEAAPLSHRAALTVQRAVAIEILVVTAIRFDNLRQLDLERNFVRHRPGGPLHLVLPAEVVKNKVPLEFPLPAETAELLRLYRQRYRPLLMTQPSSWLFPGESGQPKSKTGLSHMIRTVVKARLGLTINPHLFRHISALAYLGINPGGYEVVRRILGHKSLDTTLGFYSSAETITAYRHFDDVALRPRRKLTASPIRRERRA